MSAQNYSTLVKAGLAVLITSPGKVLTIASVSGPMHVTLDGKNSTPVYAGAVIQGPFHYLNFFNDSTADLQVSFYAGDTAVAVPSAALSPAPTYSKGTDLSGAAQLNAGGQKNFSGLDGIKIRKQITVQNLDTNNGALWIGDAALNPMVVLTPLAPPWTLESSGTFILRNYGDSALSRVVVGEIFYA